MGNTGSAHHLHNETIDRDLNPFYAQQYLRRMAGDTRKKGNQSVLESWPIERNIAECKVLPQPTESLKLRATTNGAILQAGGTISFRSKEHSEGLPNLENELNIQLQPMRRCHTLILDGQSDSLSQRKTDSSLARFQRSQTLIHMGYNKNKSQENIATDLKFQDELKKRITQTSQNTQLTRPKINKYNKKRKAPPAPSKAVSALNNNNKDKISSVEPKNSTQSKPRIYTTNANKTPTLLQSQPLRNIVAPPKASNILVAPFQRGSNIRKSASSFRPDPNSNENSKFPYRREKSFDSVLLRHNIGEERNNDRKSMLNTYVNFNKNKEDETNRITNNSSRRNTLTRKHPTNKVEIELNLTKEAANLRERKSDLHEMHISNNYESGIEKINHNSKAKSEEKLLPTEKKAKSQQTRIPQLKRTFYFGMEVCNENSQNKTSNSQLLENDDIGLLNHKIEPDEEINDNGILVHVRPTLPRRQPETPGFSPVAAWRNLLEEQKILQHERSRQKKIISNNNINESPINLVSNSKSNLTSVSNWTPQQDLEDDDEESNENIDNIVEEENKLGCKRQTSNILHKLDYKFQKRQSISPRHTFSLSLPRDVHLQCQLKCSANETEQEYNTKLANNWLVPGFNSLQKFKTNLSKNIDLRPQYKCICAAKVSNKRNNYNLQTVFDESFSTDNTMHQSDCPLYKPNKIQNDNWALYKSKLNVSPSAALTKTPDANTLKSSSVYLQPKSLNNIYAGKHIVYLPGQESINNTLRPDTQKTAQPRQKTKKSAYKRQRQDLVRESLQDVTPIQCIQRSNASIPEKNTHRFSFQSTVRVLEKRRLAEKLSKDAEIQEAQRLHELEAMKRVEEDFQRKRAPEKANLRNQLRLHLKANAEIEEYRSLPLNLNYRLEHNQQSQQQKISDVNNNIFCRAEPDGAVSPTLDFNDNLNPIKPTRRFDFNCDKSESETQTSDLQS